MGLFGTITGLIGASKKKNASKQAQAAIEAKLNEAIGTSNNATNLIRGDYATARGVLDPTVTAMGDLIGINGDPAAQSALDRLKASPLYTSLFNTGEEAVLQNAAATGGIRGGNTQRGLAEFGADTFAKVIQQQLGNLGGLAGIGMGATDASAAASTNNMNNIIALLSQMGQNKARGITDRANLTAGMWNNVGGFADSVAKSFIPGGSAFSKIF